MEFQAVLMAGGQGSRMTDLTDVTPKALLPVANMPLIWYPIQMLERAGFTDAMVVVMESALSDIQKVLTEICKVSIQLDFHSIPDGEDGGTADSLRHLPREKIKSDLLVVSCDLVTDFSLHLLADVHRTHDASLTMLLAPQPDLTEASVPGGKNNKKIEKDFIGLDEKENRVLFFSSEADFEEQKLTLKRSLLKKHPYVNMHTQLMDGHVYLIKRWVLDFLAADMSISAIKGELVPYLVRKQFSRPPKKTDLPNPNTSVLGEEQPNINIRTFSEKDEDELSIMAREMSSWNDHQGDMANCYHDDKIRCYAYVMHGGQCIRANTVAMYCEANRQMPRQLSVLVPEREMPLIHPEANIPQRPQIGTDSMIGEGTTISEKVSIKRSVIGNHCIVGEKVRITNSVIMNHVTIKDGCVLSGCIICNNAHVSEKCELKDCLVSYSFTTQPAAKSTNEVLVDADRMMEI